MDRAFVARMAGAAGCSRRTLALIRNINMARQLLTDIPAEDFRRLGDVISRRCLQTARRIYRGDLEFILLTNL